jgi:hypothetical protein
MMASPVPAGVPPHDPVNHSVIAPVPFIPPVTVNVVLLPLQMLVVPVAPVGAVDEVFTVILVLAGDVSLAGTLSTWAFTVAVPLVPLEVNVVVASPDACMSNCWGTPVVPSVEVQVTGNPINLERLETGITVLSEFLRKLAVMVEVFPRVVGVLLQIAVGEDVTFNCSHGLASNEPAPGAPVPAALLQVPAAIGPVLQPHQLFSAFTLPSEFTK